MKKHLLIGLSLLAVLTGCSQDEEVSRSQYRALSFETFVGKGTTRALPKTAFAEGDNFGVIAYRHGTTPWTDGIDTELFMENVPVTLASGTWTYAPLKYWEEGINHTFLAYSPYSASYALDPGAKTKLMGFITADNTADQVDLLYTFPEAGSKDLQWEEGRKVVMTFRHALSQIKISASTDQDYSGYYTATIRQVSLAGIGNTGDLNLGVTDADTSPWTSQGSTKLDGYTATTAALDIPLSTTETLLNDGVNLFMQVPQTIAAGGTVTFQVTYDITAHAAGNASNAGTGKVAVIKIPAITWEHNRIYHYKVKMDLQQLLSLKPIEVADPEVVEWEQGTETKLPEDLTVTIQPSADGDTPQTGTGNATLGITKTNAAGQTQTVEIRNPEKNDQWIVEVGPEIATPATPTTRADKEPPASWLKVCRVEGDTSGTEVSKLYGKEDATIQIKITEENSSGSPRQAEVVIRRALSGVTRILVTQEKAPAAYIEANSTQFTMEGGTNRFSIINPSTEQWTLSLSEGADSWLSLQDESGNAVTSGTTGQVIQVVAQANTTSSLRKATITLARVGQDPVLVEVAQAAPQPMTVSENNFAFSYSGGSRTLTINNPEGGKSGFDWTLQGQADWLTVSPATGNGKADKVTIVTRSINTSAAARTPATFTLRRQGQADITINVTQTGAPATTLSPTSLSEDYSAQTCVVIVSSPAGIPWNVSSNQSWAELGSASGNGNAPVVLNVEANPNTTSRIATVTLTRAGQSAVTMTLTQTGMPDVTTITPQKYMGKPKNTSYVFHIQAPNNKAWTAKIQGYPYSLCDYMSFANNRKLMETSGTGPSNLLVYLSGLGPSDGGFGLIDITVQEGGKEKVITVGFAIGPNF